MQPCKVYADFKTEFNTKYQATIGLRPTVKRHRSITSEVDLFGSELSAEPANNLKRAHSLNSSKEKRDGLIRLRREEIIAPTHI